MSQSTLGSESPSDPIAKRIADLSPQRRRLVEELLRKSTDRKAPPLRRRAETIAPLSYAQQRLWVLDQLTPGSPFYVENNVLPFGHRLNRAAVEQTLNEIVRRHETLRTTFQVINGRPMQVVSPELRLTVPEIDLRDVPLSQRAARIADITSEQARQIADISRDPLIRTTLLRFGANEDALVVSLHHIACDGWSLGLLVFEFTALYADFASGKRPALPDLRIQYADYALWQREWLSGDVLAGQLEYWKTQLADLPILQLPTDRVRPPTQSYRGATFEFVVEQPLYAALKAFSQREGVSLFMTLLAAFATLLHRYTGQDDIVVGVPISSRNHPELAPIIGFFVNTLVMRNRIAGDPTIRQFLSEVRETALQAYAHQDVPFEKLVEELQPERDVSRNPLYQTVFQLFSALNADGVRPEQMLDMHRVDTGISKFDLRVDLLERATRLDGYFEYSTDLFEPSTIERMAAHFRRLLEAMVANPDCRLSELPMMSDAEATRIAIDWNRTEAPPPCACVHELFEAQVRRAPAAVAVQCERAELTYAAVNERANRLAHCLSGRGVGRGVAVAVYMTRCHDWIAAMLAVWKAGGVYTPVDPDYPVGRVRWMLEDCGASIVLTSRALTEALRNQLPRAAAVLAIEDLTVELATMPTRDPRVPVELNDVAYIVYTSGSSGRPKGVMIRHEGLSNVATAQQQVLRVGPATSTLQSSSVSFDASIFEVLMAVASGGRLCIVPPDLPSGAPLADFLEARRVTTALFSPTLLATLPSDRLPSLQTIATAGEACPSSLVRLWSPGRRFLNLYGPTEATIWSTFAECTAADERPPIGKPIRNTSVYVLDRNRRPVPVGVMGEIYLGGIGLAAGYVNRADLTTERFVEVDVHTPGRAPRSTSAQRLYRTGDLGRFLPDGNLEFFGRVDEQVKLRGFRIELGEIESSLKDLGSVRDAAVLLREDAPGEKHIVAYITRADELPTSEDVSAEWEAERVASWQRLYEDSYAQYPAPADPTFNIAGWNSSYTGLAIPEPEMAEQVDGTVRRLKALGADRVLEVGCGSGLLLFRLARQCDRYVGTDFSGASLDYVRTHLNGMPNVELVECRADDFAAVAADTFDLVVLNSVVQYFPSGRYLERVLRAALERTRDGGHVFIGDVRSLPLLEVFHGAVELERSNAGRTTADVRERVRQRVAEESELVIDPRWFSHFQRAHPRIQWMKIEPRRGRLHNELTRFRYDVTFSVGGTQEVVVPERTLSWSDLDGLDDLRRLLHSLDDSVVVRDVPNARIEREVQTVALLHEDACPRTVGELRRDLDALPRLGVEPEDVWQLADEGPYDVRVVAAASGQPDRYDVVLRRRSSMPRTVIDGGAIRDMACDEALDVLTNVPFGQSREDRWTVALRTALQTRLPGHMIPSTFVVLGQMPLTPSGKVDRRALPAPDRRRPGLPQPFVTPRTPIEQAIAAVWQELLGVARVGVDDNFFDLGGHSLLLVQLHRRITAQLGVALSVMDLFRYPTISTLARFVSQKHAPEDRRSWVSSRTA
jgi:amino acid adenylation domain-containing protein